MIMKWVAAILVLVNVSAVSAEQPDNLTIKPNVVVIISDDQGWGDIGYNNSNVYTPNLDKLAQTGATLTRHYVMPQCTPTRVALMTGRYPSRFGGPALQASNRNSFPIGTPTLASMFKAMGYKTYLSGKWHLGSRAEFGPNKFGFDSSYGSLTGAVGMYDHRYRKGEFFETWHRDGNLIDGSENGVHATDLIAAEAVRVIESKREEPFFLYVPFHNVHTPLDERDEFVDQPTQLDPNREGRWMNEEKIRWFNDPDGVIQKESDPEKRLLLASAYHLDHAVGEIVDALDRTGQRDNTLILFSSDNGPQGSWGGNAYPDDLKLTDFNQPIPMRGKKVDVWEGGIHVPGIANWPAKIKAGEINEVVHIVDWFPTLAKLIDYQSDDNILFDGTDLTGVLFSNEGLPERDLYWVWHSNMNRWALRYGEWKIVKYGIGSPRKPDEWQLFNLRTDPAEKNDVARSHSEVLSKMHQRFLLQRMKDANSGNQE